MPETYEKNGIIYFKEPYGADALQWAFSHRDCDSLVLLKSDFDEGTGCGEAIHVVCYASRPEFNDRMESLLETLEYPEPLRIHRGYVPFGRNQSPVFRVEDKKMRACYMNSLYYVHACFDTLDRLEFEQSIDFIFDTGSLYTVVSPDMLFTPVMLQVLSDLDWKIPKLEPALLKTASDSLEHVYKMCFRDVRIGTVRFEKFYCCIMPDKYKLAVLGTDFINCCSSISFDRKDMVFEMNLKEYYDSGDPIALDVTDRFQSMFALNNTDIDGTDLASAITGSYNRQGGYVIPESYEKDGIIYYEKPYRVDSSEWYFAHPFCNSIILNKSDIVQYGCGCMDYVCCYASSPEYNDALEEIQRSGIYGDDTEIVEGDMEDPGVLYI